MIGRTVLPRPLVHLALVLLASACTATRVETDVDIARPVPAPPPGVVAPAPDGGPGDVGRDDEAVRVEPYDGVVGSARPVSWDRASYDREAGTVDLFWWSGVEPCTVLDEVLVEFTEDELVLTVLEGAPEDAAAISCIELAVRKATTVRLDQDLGDRRIVDGATR